MKKFICSICLMAFMAPAFAIDDITPKWEDFSPQEYSSNLKYIKDDTFVAKHPFVTLLGYLTIIGIPFALVTTSRSNAIDTNNYWYQRKQDFEKELNLCKKIKNYDSRINAYMQLRHNEQAKTAHMESLLMQEQQIYATNNAAIQTQNAINNANRPKTYTQYGNTIYSY